MSLSLSEKILNVFSACRQPLFAVLDNISVEQLNWKPAPESRSIGEMCRHLIRVDGWFLRRLGIEPIVGDATSGELEEIRRYMEMIQEQISEIVAAAQNTDDLLRERTSLDGTASESLGVAVIHIAQHYLYHLAQIIYLRRAQDREWEAPTKAWETATHVIGNHLLGIEK